jgi:hypothetical protein
MNTQAEYDSAVAHQRPHSQDIAAHMPTLLRLAKECETVVEFGNRTGNSTLAFLLAGCRTYSFDLAGQQFTPPADSAHLWSFHQANTTTLLDIPECDMLFIDTLHNYDVVVAELLHAPKVRRYIAFHDTVLFAYADESGPGPGIWKAVEEFIAANKGVWELRLQHDYCNGLTVLERVQ